MKVLLIIMGIFVTGFLFASGFEQNAFADNEWTTIMQSSLANTLTNVDFIDADTGYGISGSATIFKTTDGGTTWTGQTPTTTNTSYFTFLDFIDADTGYVVGNSYTGSGYSVIVLKTTDGGTTWTEQIASVSSAYKTPSSVDFIDADTGYVTTYSYSYSSTVGYTLNPGTVLKTSDGGDTWTEQTPTTTSTFSYLNSIDFVDADTGYVTNYYGLILKTTDGGSNWTEIPSPVSSRLNLVKFFDADTGYSRDDFGSLFKTIDGGDTWTTISSSNYFNKIIFVNENIWYGFYSSALSKTTDGGLTWTVLSMPFQTYLASVDFVDADTGFATGNYGVIFKTTDGGNNWTVLNHAFYLTSVDFVDADTGYVTPWHGPILKTTDGGNTWSFQPSSGYATNSLDFIDENTGFAQFYYGISKTTDGGATWTIHRTLNETKLRSADFVDADTGYAVGYSYDSNGYSAGIEKTTDGGATWTVQTVPTVPTVPTESTFRIYHILNSVDFIDADTGYTVGSYGTILKTTDGGDTWTVQSTPLGDNAYLSSVQFIDADTGYAAGSRILLKTTDGGTTWTALTAPDSTTISIFFLDANTGYTVGSYGRIFKTIDGGVNWTQQSSGTTNFLSSVDFVDADTGYAVGSLSTVLKSTFVNHDLDNDGFDSVYFGGEDCDDTEPLIYPGATETFYDGVDQDCNGTDANDQDADGVASTQSVGGTPDCDDSDAEIFPGASELDDGVDNNCDGTVDDGLDTDGDGFTPIFGNDCDDTKASVYPGATEDPDGLDNDCNGIVDDGVSTVDASTCSSVFGGTWDGVNTCTVASSFIINSGQNITIPSDVILTLTPGGGKEIRNNGGILNIHGTLLIKDGTGLSNFGGTVNNYGYIISPNLGNIYNADTINNYYGGNIEFFFSFHNHGILNNLAGGTINIGVVSTNGFFTNYSDGTVNNHGIINSNFSFVSFAGGNVNNFSDVNNSGQINNHSTFNNSGNIINECTGTVIGSVAITGNQPITNCTITTTLPPDATGEVTNDIDGNTVITVEDISGSTTEITLPAGSVVDDGTIEVDIQTTGQNSAVEISSSSVPYPPGKTIKISSNPGSAKVCIVDKPTSVLATGLPNCGSTDVLESTVVLDCDAQTYSFTGFPDSPTARDYKCTKVTETGNTFMIVEGLANSFVWPGSNPEIGEISIPVTVQVGSAITATADFVDADFLEIHTAEWDWGDGTVTAGNIDQILDNIVDEHTYTTPGVHSIELIVIDQDGREDIETFQFVAVYDPEGGFVTGGGWIESPPSACTFEDCIDDTVGKATFGFVSKYQKGATEPSGDTQFHFKAGNLKFKSSDYEWLTIVIAGAKAQYKGSGTINGEGDYGFMITGLDADLNDNDIHTDDKFRIKIWDKNNEDDVVYDNKRGSADDSDDATAIGGGSIVIHKAK